MAQQLVLASLQEFLDEWTEGTDWRQLEVRILAGELTLSDLQLRREPLEAILGQALPFFNGRIGQLRARWSWSRLFSAPAQIDVSDMSISLGIVSGGSPAVDAPQKSRCRHGLAGRIMKRICDRLQISGERLQLRVCLAEEVECKAALNFCSLHSELQQNGEVLRQEAQFDGLSLAVDPQPGLTMKPNTSSCGQWCLIPHDVHGAVLESACVYGEAQRTLGQQVVDSPCLDVTANLKDFKLKWSLEQHLALVRAFQALGIKQQCKDASEEIHEVGDDDDLNILVEDDTEILRMLEDLSADDVSVLRAVNTRPGTNTSLRLRIVAETVVLVVSETTCLDKDEERVSLTSRVFGGEVVFSMSSGSRKSFYCGINAMEVLDGMAAGTQSAVLMLLPRKENTEVAFKLQSDDTAPGLSALDVTATGVDINLLPSLVKWGPLLADVRLDDLCLFEAKFCGSMCVWSASLKDSCIALPASPSSARLFLRAENVAASGRLQEAGVFNVDLTGVSVHMVDGKLSTDMVAGGHLLFEMRADAVLAVRLWSVEVNVAVWQLRHTQGLIHAAWQFTPQVELRRALSIKLDDVAIILTDNIGLAMNTGLVLRASVNGSRCPGQAGHFQVSGLSAQSLDAAGSDRELLQTCDADFVSGDTFELMCKRLDVCCTFKAARALSLVYHMVLSFPFSCHAGRRDSDVLPGNVHRLVVNSGHFCIYDPEGHCGGLELQADLVGLELCLSPLDFCISHADLQIHRGSTGACPRPVAKLSCSNLAGSCIQDPKDSRRFLVAFASSLQLVDLTIGSVAFDTLGEPLCGSAAVQTHKGVLEVHDGCIELKTLVLDSSGDFIQELTEVGAEMRAAYWELKNSRSILVCELPPSLVMQGLLVTSVDRQADAGAFSPGNLIQSIGGDLLHSSVNIREYLCVAQKPVAVEFLLPQRDEELLVHLSMQSFLLRVDAFRTRPMVLGMDVQVQQAVVTMPRVVLQGWKGPLMGLFRHIGRSYATALAKDLPSLTQSFVFASKVLEDTFANALTVLQESKSIKAVVARGQALRGGGSGRLFAFTEDSQGAFSNEGSAKGMAVAAVTAVSGAAANAGGAVCDAVDRGLRSWRSNGAIESDDGDVVHGSWSWLWQ